IEGEKYSLCEDFVTADTELVTAWLIKHLIRKDNNTSDYGKFIVKSESFGIPDARRQIDMMLTLDFIIVNTDRHYNNFGLIIDPNTLEWLSVAPIYDSGTAMWCRDITEDILPDSPYIQSKPFRSRHIHQIELVTDFSWLNLDALDGIELEYAEIIDAVVPNPESFAPRARKLCGALRRRIELLQEIVSKAGHL
ncbi:MAG: hypothetical protein LBU99_05335, partial [Spirochaetaceae bacterium]|nr:hypothetical protein [Spirochaetaceae bacterium]